MSADDKKRKATAPASVGVARETRVRKKAREAMDLMTNSFQRKESRLNLLGQDYSGPSEAELKMMFRVFDRDGDGHISSDELGNVMRSMGKRPLTKKIQKMLEECDTDGNGTIELDEFVTYMQKKAKEKADKYLKKSEAATDDGEDEKAEKKKKKAAAAASTSSSSASSSSSKKQDTDDDVPGSDDDDGDENDGVEADTPLVRRASSIADFYGVHAGLHGVTGAQMDQFDNPLGEEFDLGREGAFAEFSVLVGEFFEIPGFDGTAGAALEAKGFSVLRVKTQKEFIDRLDDYDVAWIISGYKLDDTTTEAQFVEAVRDFHETGGGIFLLADNHPYTVHANACLKAICNAPKPLVSSTPGQKVLSLSADASEKPEPGHFSGHLLTTGIANLYEGHTICYFEEDNVPAQLDVIATSSDEHAAIFASSKTAFAPHCGRIALDTGFTKLYVQWDTAGTARFVKNACVWLLGLDHRIAIDAPIRGKIAAKQKQVKSRWQYHHNGWHDYDASASDAVEDAYQGWKANPYVDVRAVKSGVFHYSVDFNRMKQKNLEHFAHTERDIRRVEQEVWI